MTHEGWPFNHPFTGGDTIREICKVSGAHLELVKDAVNINQSERLFKLIGSQEQIQQAVQLVAEKIGTVSSSWSFLFILIIFYYLLILYFNN